MTIIIHGIDKELLAIYEELDCFGWLLEKKKAGLVKHVGFSFHDTPELLDEILTRYPEMEFVQLMINYLDWDSEWVQSRACYEVAVKHGKPVTVMEPVRGGTLADLPQDVEKIFKEKNSDYPQLLEGGGGMVTDCVACGQCESVCPQHITIIENLKTIAGHIG